MTPAMRAAVVMAILLGGAVPSHAQDTIDLPTVLRLAGAQNLDVQIARQRLAEAKAAETSATLQLLPWLTPALAYRAHGGLTQDVVGNIVDAEKHSYGAGLFLTAQVDLGEALYRRLSAQQVQRAAEESLGIHGRDVALNAATGYFELVRSRARVEVVRESAAISREYQDEVRRAVEVGIAAKSDELRVQVQTERYEVQLRRAQEQEVVASARLAEILHLDPAARLEPAEAAPAGLVLVPAESTLESLVGQALASRPELRRGGALVAAADRERQAVTLGPLVPTVALQGFAGGLGGGRRGIADTSGSTDDFAIAIGWRIGPGGLLDKGRTAAARARLEIARLDETRVKDAVVRQVAEAYERTRSLAFQSLGTRENLATAARTLQLSQDRKQFAVGAVLEVIQAQQDLTQARSDYVDAVAESDKAQYSLAWAIGSLSVGSVPPAPAPATPPSP